MKPNVQIINYLIWRFPRIIRFPRLFSLKDLLIVPKVLTYGFSIRLFVQFRKFLHFVANRDFHAVVKRFAIIKLI